MRLTKVFLLLMLAFNLSASLFAQTKTAGDDDEVIRVDTQLVDVPVIITDKTRQTAFESEAKQFCDLRRRQAAGNLGFRRRPPRRLKSRLLLDTSGSTRSDLPLIQRAAENFIASLTGGRPRFDYRV